MEGNGFLLDFIDYLGIFSGLWLIIFIYGILEIDYLKIKIRWVLLYLLGASVGLIVIAETVWNVIYGR